MGILDALDSCILQGYTDESTKKEGNLQKQHTHTHQPPKPDPAAPPPHLNNGVLSLLQPRASHDSPSSLHCQIKT